MSSADGDRLAERPFLCRLDDVPSPGAKGIVLGEGRHAFDLIVVRQGPNVLAYHNSCPHKGTPLETFPDRFLDEHATHLVCSTHGARFRLGDGFCVWGPCKGKHLKPVAVRLENGAVFLVAPLGVKPMLDGS